MNIASVKTFIQDFTQSEYKYEYTKWDMPKNNERYEVYRNRTYSFVYPYPSSDIIGMFNSFLVEKEDKMSRSQKLKKLTPRTLFKIEHYRDFNLQGTSKGIVTGNDLYACYVSYPSTWPDEFLFSSIFYIADTDEGMRIIYRKRFNSDSGWYHPDNMIHLKIIDEGKLVEIQKYNEPQEVERETDHTDVNPGKYKKHSEITGIEGPNSIDVSSDGRWLAVTSFDKRLRLYDASSFELIRTVSLGTSFPNILKFFPDSSKIIAGGKSPSIFDLSPLPKDGLPSLKKLFGLKGYKQDPQGATFDHDGIHFWTVGGEYYVPSDYFIRKWNLETGELKEKWKLDEVTYGIDISNNGKWLVISQASGSVKMFELATGNLLWNFMNDNVVSNAVSVAFSNDDSIVYMASSSLGSPFALFAIEVATGKLIEPLLDLQFEKYKVNQVTVMKSGNLLLTLYFQKESKSMIIIIDPITGEIIWESPKYERWSARHVLSPDEEFIYCTWSDPDKIVVFKVTGDYQDRN